MFTNDVTRQMNVNIGIKLTRNYNNINSPGFSGKKDQDPLYF